jgi:GAF domain-containing protein
MQTKMGGISGVEINLPSVPLYINGEPNYSNVSSYVALTGKTVNFPDVYKVEDLDFPGPRDYDALTGYRSKSMFVIALQNHENEIIGVLQLLNAQDSETGEVVPFSDEYVDLIASLASQAAVALTNAHLVKDLNNLFYAFIKSIATAIDEKSPYTGGHIKRVVDLSMMIAEMIN